MTRHRRNAWLLTLLVLNLILFGYAWVRTGVNPVLLARALLTLQFTETEIATVTHRVLLQRATDTAAGTLTTYLAERGWQFQDQLGAISTYERDGLTLFVHSRLSRGYWLYELDGIL